MLKLHILPSEFADLDLQDKAFIIASIQIKMENDKKKEKEAERKAKRKH